MRLDYQANQKKVSGFNGLCITLYTKIQAEMLRNLTTEKFATISISETEIL